MDEREYLHMYEEEEGHWWYAGMRAIVLSLLPQTLLPRSPCVLDAGCGTGFTLTWLRHNYGARVTGIDCHPAGLAFCRRRGEQSLVLGDVATLPFIDGSFDLVVSFDVLSEVRDAASRTSALAEYRRLLRSGGKLLVRVPAYEWLRTSHDTGVSTRHRYGRAELRAAVEAAGFRAERCTFVNSLLFPLAVIWRISKKAGLAPAGSDVRSTTRSASWFNGLLLRILRLEAAYLLRHDFGFGLSLFMLASAPDDTPIL